MMTGLGMTRMVLWLTGDLNKVLMGGLYEALGLSGPDGTPWLVRGEGKHG